MTRIEVDFPPEHVPLREDVHALGALVGEILSEQGGQQLLDLVELDRIAAIRRRAGDALAGAELAACVRGRPPALAGDVVRAFATWFQIVNTAERVHRIRRRREYQLDARRGPQPGGIAAALRTLKDAGATLADALALIGSLRIEPVFAAHSSEATRRTLLRKQQRIAQLLLDRVDATLTPTELHHVWSGIRIELTTAWQTEELPRERLTVGDEREQILFYLVEILYRVVPAFYEEIARTLGRLYDTPAEDIEVPNLLRFGSWAGGDMDGHPDVHGKTIRESLARHQQVIVNAYFGECQRLAQRLSQSASRIQVSSELSQRLEEYSTLLPGARASTPARHDRMPYRVLLAQIAERLRLAYEGRPHGYESAAEFRGDIRLIAASLQRHRGRHAGLVYVQRLLRRIDTFGFHLASLDVRQHASVLHQVIEQGLDDRSWRQRSSAERHKLLLTLLRSDAGPRVELDTLGKRMRAVFEAIVQGRSRYGAEAIGYFVVSGAQGADDVLAPLLLARWAEAYDRRTGGVALDIAPQFESLEALEHCGATIAELLSDPVYSRHLEARRRTQCVLIGYSDSNKEAGMCASRFAIYEGQRALTEALGAANERHVLFHARGGSIARGGSRIDALIESAPAGAVNGVLRVREQGETVRQGYGLRPIALRTLERALHAVILATAGKTQATPRESREHFAVAATIAAASRLCYRQLVYDGGAEFYEYFRAATPIDVIEQMQIGSRSTHRLEQPGIGGLLPVAWVFAWTQSRHLLPGWYGAGAGLKTALGEHGLARLRTAYAEWPFLRHMLDELEAMLARADLEIAQHYDALAPAPLRGFFGSMRAEYRLACELLLTIKQSAALLDTQPTLQRSIRLRNPYVDPMHLMQVDLLQRWRASGRTDRELFGALLASTGGIAQAMQSTG